MKLEVIASPELHRFGLPKFQTEGSAAIDLRALLNSPLSVAKQEDVDVIKDTDEGRVQSLVLKPGAQLTIDSGLKIHIGDKGFAGIVLPRSSTGSKKGLVLANGTGLIDSDYQGPLLIIAWNRTSEPVTIEDGERIAQYLITNVHQFDLDFVSEFSSASERGEGGFGSTGTH